MKYRLEIIVANVRNDVKHACSTPSLCSVCDVTTAKKYLKFVSSDN